MSQKTDSIESISTVNSQTERDAIGKTLTARASHMSLSERVTTIATNATADPDYEVDWDGDDDPDNPKNWNFKYKSMGILFLSWNTLIVVLYSTSYTSGIAFMAEEFGQSNTIVTLGLTFYLFGLAIGSMFMAPLSEVYGRKPVCVLCLAVFTVLIIPCALAKSVTALIVVRFIAAFFGSVMISTAPGMVADLVDDEHRALAISVWSIGPLNGPVIGPVIGGFVTQYLGWRWMCWIALILSAVALVFAILLKETYAPTLLQKKAARLRKETGDSRWWSRYDQKASLPEILKLNLSRPFVMAVTEPIWQVSYPYTSHNNPQNMKLIPFSIFWNIYIAIIYGILYLCFVAYPIVFRDIRGWQLGIGIGVVLTIACEPLIRRLINSHAKDPETGKVYPEAMVSFVCICAAMIPVGELWFAWTCSPASIHWIAPVLAATACMLLLLWRATRLFRSILGGVLPLAGASMYASLGPNWAGTLLGVLEVIIVPIPFVFYKYGHKIRMKSPLIVRMQEEKTKLEGKRARRQIQLQQANRSDEEKVAEVV
ncbi:Major facilitator superfamily domain general substrate transporter [Penicillium expansum]|nr:Major facilitator superfamily domain general substrate transporter [Penicillium expansum]